MSCTTKNTMATKKKEAAFVAEYCRDPKQTPFALVAKAGFNPKDDEEAQKICKRLLNKTSVKEAIKDYNNNWRDELSSRIGPLISMIHDLATFDPSEVYKVKDGEVVVKDLETMSRASRSMIKSISTIGGKTIVTLHDRYHYARLLVDVAGLLNKTPTLPTTPLPQQRQALFDVRDGVRTPLEAALDLEADGVPVPETIKAMVNRPEIAVAVKQEVFVDIPTPEEIAARRKKLLAEVENEKSTFLPTRQEEVRAIKADLGTANGAFDVTKD